MRSGENPAPWGGEVYFAELANRDADLVSFNGCVHHTGACCQNTTTAMGLCRYQRTYIDNLILFLYSALKITH